MARFFCLHGFLPGQFFCDVGMNGLLTWDTMGIVLTLLAVFFGGLLALVTGVGLLVGLLSALLLFAVPARWRRAIIQATPRWWGEAMRRKYLSAPLAADLTGNALTRSSATPTQPKRFGSLNRVPELQDRRLLGVHGFSQTDVQNIEEDASVWLLEFEGAWWASLVVQIAPAWISPTFQLAWDVYSPDAIRSALADPRMAHHPTSLSPLLGARFSSEHAVVSDGMMELETRLHFQADGPAGDEHPLVLRMGYLQVADHLSRTGKTVLEGHALGLEAQLILHGALASNPSSNII